MTQLLLTFSLMMYPLRLYVRANHVLRDGVGPRVFMQALSKQHYESPALVCIGSKSLLIQTSASSRVMTLTQWSERFSRTHMHFFLSVHSVRG